LQNATIKIGVGGAYSSGAHAGPARSEATKFVSVLISDPNLLQTFVAGSYVSIAHPKLGEISAGYRSPALAADALRNCEDKKMADWGIDPNAWHALRSPPRPLGDLISWVRPENHRLWNSANPNGQAVVRLTIGMDGRVTECHGIDPSVPRELNDAACAGLKRRGRFVPALDFQGNPVSSPYVVVVEFEKAS
jgi:protein TonB